ncbi:MAG: ERCC4 domain-containing protein [Deltaproteobacteria bacterium]|nr:ERCC4 domain-containing protein [Deltaproteobacteria bacterium]
MIIVIDTREQLPYEFKTENESGTLQTGDYSIKGAEDLVAIERKTIDDLIGCLTGGRERFEKELRRSRALEYFALVIECSLLDLTNGRYTSKMNPKSAVQSVLAFSVRYGMPVFFAENRVYGGRLTESLLLKFAREMENRVKVMTIGAKG